MLAPRKSPSFSILPFPSSWHFHLWYQHLGKIDLFVATKKHCCCCCCYWFQRSLPPSVAKKKEEQHHAMASAINQGSAQKLVNDGVLWGESFAMLSRTSMAAPHIAGIIALLKQQHPQWGPAAIHSALLLTTTRSLDLLQLPIQAEQTLQQ